MKKLILTSFIMILLSIAIYVYFIFNSKEPFHCDVQILSHITKDGQKFDLNLHTDILLLTNNKGAVYIIGTLRGERNSYLVSRRLYFTTNSPVIKNISQAIITDEKRHDRDNAPNELWKYVIPEVVGVKFYIEVKNLNKNAILIQGVSNPYYICKRS